MKSIKWRTWDVLNGRWAKGIHEFVQLDKFGEIENDHYYIHQLYTGEKDSLGQEVYIGDYIKYKDGSVVEVRWSEDGDYHPCIIFTDLMSQGGPYKIVGNIFEPCE